MPCTTRPRRPPSGSAAFVGTHGAGSLLALTFDDGPHPTWTPRLLDVLDRHQVEATFFVIGANARRHPDVLREIASRGHAVGNHTDTHLRMPLHGARTIRDELCRTTDAIEAVGVEPASAGGHRLMRPPVRAAATGNAARRARTATSPFSGR